MPWERSLVYNNGLKWFVTACGPNCNKCDGNGATFCDVGKCNNGFTLNANTKECIGLLGVFDYLLPSI